MTSLSFKSFHEALIHKNPYVRFFQDLQLCDESDIVCYLQYLPARHVLLARGGKGLASFENLGINLSQDKSFDLEKLKNPQAFSLLAEFVHSALEREHYCACPLSLDDEPAGLIILASNRPLTVNDIVPEWVQGLELIASHRTLKRRMEKFDQFCPDTEVLTPSGIYQQLHKEVVRARRIKLPVSTILFSIDRFDEISKGMNGIQRKNWAMALGKLLRTNSRVNDLVGKLSENLFVVMLPHTALEGARAKAMRLSEVISEATLKVGGQSLKFTVSGIINEYPRLSEDAEELLNKGLEIIKANKHQASSILVAGSRPHFQADFDVET